MFSPKHCQLDLFSSKKIHQNEIVYDNVGRDGHGSSCLALKSLRTKKTSQPSPMVRPEVTQAGSIARAE